MEQSSVFLDGRGTGWEGSALGDADLKHLHVQESTSLMGECQWAGRRDDLLRSSIFNMLVLGSYRLTGCTMPTYFLKTGW